MKYSVQQIKYELLAYMKSLGPDFKSWAVGISDDPCNDMRSIPGADPDTQPWIFKPAVSQIAARNIRNYFTGQLACLPVTLRDEGSLVFAIRLTDSSLSIRPIGQRQE